MRPAVAAVLEAAVVAAVAGEALLPITDKNSRDVSDGRKRKTERRHTTPTVLSVYDDSTSSFVDALSNNLYDDLKSAKFVMPDTDGIRLRGRSGEKVDELTVTMDADRWNGVKFGESITISWEDKSDDNDYRVNGRDSVIALYCPAEEENPYKFRDAATLSQIRSTEMKHAELLQRYGNKNDLNINSILLATKRRRTSTGLNTWWIPSFPIIREPSCEFRMWKRSSHSTRNENASRSSVPLLTLAGRTGSIPLHLSLENPTSIHIALTSDPFQMVVHFITGAFGKPFAEYGPTKDSSTADLTMRAEGTSTSYEASDMCQPPANITEPGKFIDPGQLHTVTLADLVPDTKYTYRVGLTSGQGIVWSGTFNFRSALPPGSNQAHSFVVYGDQGCPDDGWALGGNLTAAMVARELDEYDDGNRPYPVRLVHHAGDLSYARGSAYLWDAWLDMVQPFASRIPLMIGVGNHEYDHTAGGVGRDPSGVSTDNGFRPSWGNFATDSGGECGVPTAKRFLMPQTQGNYSSNGVFWYSYSYGMIHTIMISSEHDLSRGSPQHEWLTHNLRSVNRTLTPWVILESHRPMYHAKPYWADNSVGIAMRAEFEDLLRRYHVDVFFAGHYHSYLRTCDGLYGSVCNNGGPTHITVGTAGAHLDDESLGLYDNVWTERYLALWGYGRVTVYNSTDMLFEFVNAKDGTVEDKVKVRRRR